MLGQDLDRLVNAAVNDDGIEELRGTRGDRSVCIVAVAHQDRHCRSRMDTNTAKTRSQALGAAPIGPRIARTGETPAREPGKALFVTRAVRAR